MEEEEMSGQELIIPMEEARRHLGLELFLDQF